jgi:hypothetical protein
MEKGRNITMNGNKDAPTPFTGASERRTITPVDTVVCKTKLTRINVRIKPGFGKD